MKNFWKWYHKRKAHKYELLMLPFLKYRMGDAEHEARQGYWLTYYKVKRDYHLKELEKFK